MEWRAVRPADSEFAPFYQAYVGRVPAGDIVETLGREIERTRALLSGVDTTGADFRYAADKWSVKEVVGHVIDAERVFAYRALSFARGSAAPLPSFDEDRWAIEASSATRMLPDLLEELTLLRRSHVLMFGGLEQAVWSRGGEASGKFVTVRGLAWILAGHEIHHRTVLAERYGIR